MDRQKTAGRKRLAAWADHSSDPSIWGKVEKPFFDIETQLTGKPDYLIRHGDVQIPVEVKSGYAPTEPYASHVFQLLAYCLLVERATGQRPPYGIVKYRNRSFAIDYTTEQELALLDLLDEMRLTERKGEPDAPTRKLPAVHAAVSARYVIKNYNHQIKFPPALDRHAWLGFSSICKRQAYSYTR